MKEYTKLSAPWVQFYREVEALFSKDPEVKVTYNDDETTIKLLVENHDKAEALEALLPSEKTFGNITVRICVIPANNTAKSELDLVKTAFKGNPALAYVMDTETVFGTMNYVVFEREVVQYYNDDIGDVDGKKSTLYEDIARNVLNTKGIHYCTSL